ncbi:MAG TPA: CPBP family intramembrane glutamic endopeptidase [Terracidiphilus sp.]|nr:CPBP family intramembrane glutamic endopeptidase [Terracidiphilus sp.]
MSDLNPTLDSISVPEPEPAPAPQPAIAVPAPPVFRRVPHLGHAALLFALLIAGLISSAILMLVSMHYRLFGIGTVNEAMRSLGFNLGAMVVVYAIAFVPAAIAFPHLWGRGVLLGLQWNASSALGFWRRLVICGIACFGVAFACKSLFHFPDHTPMQDLLRTPADMWLMLVFAVTLAPLCEEIIFRGMLLPAFATAADWTAEKLTGRPPRPLLANGHPQWSVPAMAIGSVLASIIFALYHSFQNANALGPAVLIFSVSIILCAVRLATRSVAASTLTHATYNFTLFVVTFISTSGFRHLHK